jgi:hypothetical protein
MSAPKIMYRFTWSWPNDPDTEFHVLVNHAGSMDLARVLEAAGASVSRVPARDYVDGRLSRERAAHGHDGGGMDASDREAMARLAQRAFGRRAD